ncbi:MAG: 2-amino-4-hydroxy-6-hydroxymethyldihydropteridine diphosphokinase [SAR202 cluster bacterium Io17-Chloro-G4]|nr:MAG: 2-amino-4-hydroxy-6-hydroxymethyldihydropteridine diphosphokinase [SAR202 cluster bacterium Io17-Chloro-G4]
MERVTAYLGLGSNLGRREENLKAAMDLLAEVSAKPDGHSPGASSQKAHAIKILRSSSLYESAPWGLKDQPDFLNCVLEVDTQMPPAGLLECAKAVEEILGRQPGLRFGPRLIDVDILLYGSAVVELPKLQIPHPRMHLRAFAVIPLAELQPDLVHPTLKLTVEQLAREVDGREGVKPWGPPPMVGKPGRVAP